MMNSIPNSECNPCVEYEKLLCAYPYIIGELIFVCNPSLLMFFLCDR